MKPLFRLLLVLSFPTLCAASQECVIVLHGLGRTAFSMSLIEEALVNENYLVWNEGYPSTSSDIKKLSETAITDGLDFCDQNKTGTVHFVTHSLGGILVRQYLQHHTISNLGSVVMLSPPNHGSEVVDLLKDYTIYQIILGPAAQQLGTDKGSLTEQLGPVKGEIGIITGVSSSDPWFSPVIPGDDDGKVSVESAKLDEMSDFMTVPNGHTFIMRDDIVIKQILHFLMEGTFYRAAQQTHD